MGKLTDVSVRNAKPSAKRRSIPDNGSGLYLIVQVSGAKSFATFTRLKTGKQVKVTHGDYPTLPLADARVLHAETVKQAKAGADPRDPRKDAERRRREAASNTFQAVAQLYLDSEKVKRLRTADQVRDRLERLTFPTLGRLPIADIKRSQYNALLDHIEKRSGAVAADRTLSAIWQVLKFHAKRDDDYVIPLIPGMNRTSPKERARDRILSDDELKRVWKTGNAFVQFSLLSCARRDEVAAMQWKEIKDGAWTLPARRNKSKVDLIRPLPPQALALLPPRGDDDEYVFGHVPDRPFRSFNRLRQRIADESGTSGWRLHDLRRTGRSLLSRAGINADVAEMCLGHTLKGVRRTYDRYSYFNEKRFAFEALAGQIELIVNPPKGNVTSMPSKRPKSRMAVN